MTNNNISYTTDIVYTYFLYISPLGALSASVTPHGLARVSWVEPGETRLEIESPACRPQDRLLAQNAVQQLDEYLRGERRAFDLTIDWSVLTPFQRRVLQVVMQIPYGEVRTYAQVAAQAGNARASRAAGSANAANPMPLVIPCHRVIGTDGKLHGYGGRGGLETKAWLLKLEGCPLVF